MEKGKRCNRITRVYLEMAIKMKCCVYLYDVCAALVNNLNNFYQISLWVQVSALPSAHIATPIRLTPHKNFLALAKHGINLCGVFFIAVENICSKSSHKLLWTLK